MAPSGARVRQVVIHVTLAARKPHSSRQLCFSHLVTLVSLVTPCTFSLVKSPILSRIPDPHDFPFLVSLQLRRESRRLRGRRPRPRRCVEFPKRPGRCPSVRLIPTRRESIPTIHRAMLPRVRRNMLETALRYYVRFFVRPHPKPPRPPPQAAKAPASPKKEAPAGAAKTERSGAVEIERCSS